MPLSRGYSRFFSSDRIYMRKKLKKLVKKSEERFDICARFERFILVAVAAFLTIGIYFHKFQPMTIWGFEIWKWGIMVITVSCGRLLTSWLVIMIVFPVEKNFLQRKKIVHMLHGMLSNFQVCAWLSLVLATCRLIFHNVEHSDKAMKLCDFVSRLLVSLLVGSVIWLVKEVTVKLLAASFYATTFFDRIQVSIFHQHVLQALSGHPTTKMLQNVGTWERSRRLSFVMQSEAVIDVSKFHELKREKLTLWMMEGLVKYIRGSIYLTVPNMVDNMIEELPSGEKEITSEWEANAVACTIFKNVAKSGERQIEEENLMQFMTKEEVALVLPQFAGTLDNEKINESAFTDWVVKACIDRKSLALSLQDMNTAVKQIHMLISVIVLAIIIMISVLLMGLARIDMYLCIFFVLIFFVYIFSSACMSTFESIMFVFIKHPFDVGDRCVIDGVQLTVDEINIRTTVFLTVQGTKIYYQNAILAKKRINNFSRSLDSDSVPFSIDSSTSEEGIASLKTRIKSFIESKPHHWRSNHLLVLRGIDKENKKNMTLYVNHTNFQNMVERNLRISELTIELKKIFNDLSISFVVHTSNL